MSSVLDAVPLIKAPAGWPTLLSASVAMVLLAGLDLVAAYAAKEWVHGRGPVPLAIGVVSMVGLFWIYASALQYAELIIVTLGWIVLLQVGVLVIDAIHYGVRHPPRTWIVIAVILAAQAYLVVGAPAETA